MRVGLQASNWITSVTLKNMNAQFGVPAALAFAVASAALWSTDDPAKALTTALRDPLSVLTERSPGARVKGALFQTKERYAARPRVPVRDHPPGAHERVLTLVRSRSPGEPPISGVPPFTPEQPGYFPNLPSNVASVDTSPGVRPRTSEPGLALGPGSIGGGGVSSDYTAPSPAPSA